MDLYRRAYPQSEYMYNVLITPPLCRNKLDLCEWIKLGFYAAD